MPQLFNNNVFIMQINLKILAIPELNSEIAPGPILMHLQKLKKNRFKVDSLS